MKHHKIALASVFALGTLFSSQAFADPSQADTQASMQNNAAALDLVFGMQNLKSAQSLARDCSFGDAGQACVSLVVDGVDIRERRSAMGGVVLGYKSNDNFRFGAYIDQTRQTKVPFGGLTMKKGDPSLGLFALWSQGEAGSAWHVRAAANVSNILIETNRDDDDTAEAGQGFSDVKSTSYQLDLIKDYALNSQWTFSPYVGYRETENKRLAYTELSTVDAPLTYSALKQNIQTVSAGATLTLNLFTSTQFALSAGVEEDVKNHIDDYAAFSIGDRVDDVSLAGVSEKRKIKTVGFAFKQGISSSETIGFSVIQRKVKWEPEAMVSGSIHYSKSF